MSDKKHYCNIYDYEFPKEVFIRLNHPTDRSRNEIRTYIPKVFCYVDTVLDKDESAIGSSFCSKCKKNVEPFIKYCPYCGAKAKGRRLLKKKEDINDEPTSNNSICV